MTFPSKTITKTKVLKSEETENSVFCALFFFLEDFNPKIEALVSKGVNVRVYSSRAINSKPVSTCRRLIATKIKQSHFQVQGFNFSSTIISSIMKYILVTGGVISGIGKGVVASSVGVILKQVSFQYSR